MFTLDIAVVNEDIVNDARRYASVPRRFQLLLLNRYLMGLSDVMLLFLFNVYIKICVTFCIAILD